MKTYLKFLFIIAIILQTSCSDNLDLSPEDAIADTNYFNSVDEFDTALVGLYSSLRSENVNQTTGTYGGDLNWGLCSDELFYKNSWQLPWFDVSTGGLTPNTSSVGFIWQRGYYTIYWANKILEQLAIKESNFNPEYVRHVRGQAHFVRAITYLRLTSVYGAVPLIDEILPIAEVKKPRTSVEDITRNLILPDLDIAINNLQETPYDGLWGIATKNAALGMKVRALLYIEDYEGTITAAEALEGKAVFLNDFERVFAQDNENNKEILFSIKYTTGAGEQGGYFSTPFGPSKLPDRTGINGSWSASAIATELIQAFPMIDGLPYDQSPLYDEENPWANRGERFEETFYIGEYSMVNDKLFETTMVGALDNTYKEAFPFNINKGFMPEKNKLAWLAEDESDFIVLRYTDVLLMYAEAKTELNQVDDSVYEIMDKIRNRAGIAVIPRGLSQDEMREAIRNERRIELAFESVRYFDIRRWGIAEEVMNGITSDEEFNLGSHKTFAPANYFWPIPQEVMDANPLLTQNPGY